MPTCNICGSSEFQDYRGRPNEQCVSCGSKARHRTGWLVYQRELKGSRAAEGRVLHLAPEKALHGKLLDLLGENYVTADAAPERYPHAECIKLFFPDDFQKFEDGHFTAILHNHVLEHIPGHYLDHLKEFTRLLASGGRMIFSVPGPHKGMMTREGGEHFESDEERLREFLQEDHFKIFGDDFEAGLATLRGGRLLPDTTTDDDRARIGVRPGKGKFFIWEKE